MRLAIDFRADSNFELCRRIFEGGTQVEMVGVSESRKWIWEVLDENGSRVMIVGAG